MQTDNTYPNIPSFRKIELEYLAWQITKIQAGTREFIGQKEARIRFGRKNVERWVSIRLLNELLTRQGTPGKGLSEDVYNINPTRYFKDK